MKTFEVTATHPAGAPWAGTHRVEVKETQIAPGAPVRFYAVAPAFGCGRCYRTPAIAIAELFADSAATITRSTEIEGPTA